MKTIMILALSTVMLGLWLEFSESIPACTGAGNNENAPCEPNGAENGWYSYCYQVSGRWYIKPLRCGFIDPLNITAGYKQFSKVEQKCVNATAPVKCEKTTTTAPMF